MGYFFQVTDGQLEFNKDEDILYDTFKELIIAIMKYLMATQKETAVQESEVRTGYGCQPEYTYPNVSDYDDLLEEFFEDYTYMHTSADVCKYLSNPNRYDSVMRCGRVQVGFLVVENIHPRVYEVSRQMPQHLIDIDEW